MNAVAFNQLLSAQYDTLSGMAAPRTASVSQPFSSYLSEQLGSGAAETSAENDGPAMTLYEAAAANGWNAADSASTDAAGAAQDSTTLTEAATGETTMAGANGTDEANSTLMMLLMMMMSNSSGNNNSMNTALMSLLSSTQGEGISGLMGKLASIITGQTTNVTGQAIVEKAMTRLGDPYSKSKRGTGNYVDCSYFAQWAYKQLGIDIPGTAAKQAQYCHENEYEISKDELQPGDLVFWTKHSSTAGRWNNIHHVAIYAGNGKLVEAKNPTNGVEVDDLWGEEGSGGDWEIVMYARPR